MGVVRAPGRGTAVEKCKRQKVQKLGGANARGVTMGRRIHESGQTIFHFSTLEPNLVRKGPSFWHLVFFNLMV